MEEAATDLFRGIHEAESIEDAVRDADAVILTTEWPVFVDFPASRYAELMAGDVFFDAVNRYNALETTNNQLRYIGVGHQI